MTFCKKAPKIFRHCSVKQSLYIGTAKQNRWNNPPYPKREYRNQNFINHTPHNNYIDSVSNPFHSHQSFPDHFTQPMHVNESIYPRDYEYSPYRPSEYIDIVYTPNGDYAPNLLPNISRNVFPNFPQSAGYVENFPNVTFNEQNNPNHSIHDTLEMDFEQLKTSILASNTLQAWSNFFKVSNNSAPIPIAILLDFIRLIREVNAFNNWPKDCETPAECLFILVTYLNKNNFGNNQVYNDIMLAFSRLQPNEGLFRCLALLKSRSFSPSRSMVLSILKTYADTELSMRLLELFPMLTNTDFLDSEILNAYFNSIQSLIILKRHQVIGILLHLASKKISLPIECYALLVESTIKANDIPYTLLVISNFPPRTQLESVHIDSIILKSPPNLIQKIFKFIEQLNDSQRSMLSQASYSTLVEKSIAFNYPYGISYLFGLFINFNKLVETSLMVKILEFLFRNNHTSQTAKIFTMLENFRTSDELNSLTNIFLPPAMHKISQILIEYKSYSNLYTFVMSMLNEKIVPLKPVIQNLVEHLKEIKDEAKVNEIFNFAVESDLLFDREIFSDPKEPQNSNDSHFIIDIETPKDKISEFNFSLKSMNKPMKIELLISSIDSMVCSDIPQDHVFNHILVSLGQNKDIIDSFKLILGTFIPGDPDRTPEHKTNIQTLLIRTAMRLTTNFVFESDWSGSIEFLILLNQSILFTFPLPKKQSKELYQFLSSTIEASMKENNFEEIFKIFGKMNWPAFTEIDSSDIPQYKTQLLSLFTMCLEQLALHNAYRIITYVLQDTSDENSKACFTQLLGITSNMGETSIALPLFTFMNTNKIDISIDHFIYQSLITHLGQENKLQQAKLVFQHAVANSCYTTMLSIMASPNQINLYSNLIPLEMKFLLEKRLQSLYNMHKESLTKIQDNIQLIQPFEISFLRNMLTTNRTAYQESIRTFILMLSEEFTPPLIENSSDYLKDINFLKVYKIFIPPEKLRQYLLENFVPDKDKPTQTIFRNDSPDLFIQNDKCYSKPGTYKPQFIPPFDIHIKEEPLDTDYTTPHKSKINTYTQSAWFSEVKRSINSKLSKFYWAGPITTKEDYNVIAKKVTKIFRESVSGAEMETNGILTLAHNDKIDALITEEMENLSEH